MKITIIGTGYAGLVTGTCFAEMGNQVICVDLDSYKIKRLKKGIIPIFEPGLQEMVKRNLKENRLSFTTDASSAIKKSTVIFSAVGTPPDKDYRADLSAIKAVAAEIGKYMNDYKIVVTKSTVPVGTADLIKDIIRKNQPDPIDFSVVSNPEFLREGVAVSDFMNPDRIVIGVDDPKAGETLRQLYLSITDDEHPIIITDIRSAEIIKYASNAFLATKISFINEIARFCDKANADVTEVAHGMGLDERIGHRFLHAGTGYGGSCLPKDVKAFIRSGKDYGYRFRILDAIEAVNHHQKLYIIHLLKDLLPNLKNKHIAIWGLTYKPNTDDIRGAPSLVIIRALLDEGATVHAYDPIANQAVHSHFPNQPRLHFVSNSHNALQDAHALLILTEWDEFRTPDYSKMKKVLIKPIIIDGRNLYDLSTMKKLGFTYRSIGRNDVNVPPGGKKT